ncbi:zinc finger protein Xfin isoform X2 [Prorops nasuta]|uniref:zinc finger protein Xfin isoform X2 n=1 Tax=Prorops nasuta TaxID=863751 RepID=UPI0034CF5EBF
MMEGSGTGVSRLDCYEDMFKEITRKLYGEDPDHRTSSVQNEFETSVSYKNDEDTGNGTDGSDDGNWTCEDEPLKGTDGSRIAAYHSGKATWRCYECGDVMGGGPREVAEHFMELHSSRIIGDDARNRHHSPRKDYLQADLKIDEVISYLERVRERAERSAPPSRRTQETQTVPAALLPMTSTFLLQELPSTQTPTHLHQNSATMPTSATTSASGKRYTCPYCPYGTDRRDLYTRHENIHREEKPFHCYICYKPFNRADHVKKHFLRMHREHGYELSRIRRPAGSSAPKPLQSDAPGGATATGTTNGQQQQQQHTYPSGYTNNKNYQLQPNSVTNNSGNSTGIYQATSMPTPGIMQPDANCTTGRRVQNGGCNSKSHLKAGAKGAQERRYTCCYCSWSGVDNWCLKRHLNTHLKPFACTLCEYKAARAERLATHVLKVHNRRQCSRCSFLGEDAAQLQLHQLHVHRVSSASAPATSTAQTVQPSNNRHQQPLHPVGGGRPPPGPPVFPAPAPAIAPATTVIPPTTILGCQMEGVQEVFSTAWSHFNDSPDTEKQSKIGEGSRRSRKQSQPRKVTCVEELEDEDLLPSIKVEETVQETKSTTIEKKNHPARAKIPKEKPTTLGKRLRCHLCPRESIARGSRYKPYHTKASLALHKFWKHRKDIIPKSVVSKASKQSPVSSITLRATVFTSPGYGYHR